MTLPEWRQVFRSIGRSPYWITFSGGETFLKKDMVDIVNTSYDICRPQIVNIPTNGIQTNTIIESVSRICEHCKKSQIIINLSIDAIEEMHDQIRGVPNNYKKVITTYHKLRKLDHKNLSIGIHTVVSKFNIDSFSTIANTLMNYNPDQYITEIAENRNELKNMSLDITPDIVNYRGVADFMIHRLKNSPIEKRMNRITQAFRLEYYQLVKKILHHKKQVLPCYAGITSCHISPDGEVWNCCIKAKSIGNLREKKYNFNNIWKSKKAKVERKKIKDEKCYCPLANVAYTNMLMDFQILWRVFYRVFIKKRI
jgi:sulfatase maturation enzyme AslB (radical SAM superfamily)